jgi:hypothetical protein
MKLSLKTSGGIGNIQIQGQLETEDLPQSLAERVRTVLTPAHLTSTRSAEVYPMTDAMQYELGLYLDDGFQHFEVNEADAEPAVLDIVQELVQEVIRRKQAQR